MRGPASGGSVVVGRFTLGVFFADRDLGRDGGDRLRVSDGGRWGEVVRRADRQDCGRGV